MSHLSAFEEELGEAELELAFAELECGHELLGRGLRIGGAGASRGHEQAVALVKLVVAVPARVPRHTHSHLFMCTI